MKRSEFDSHPIWNQATTLLGQADALKAVDADEQGQLDRIHLIIDYVLTHRDMASTYAAFFTGSMLDPAAAHIQQATSYIASRASSPQNRAQTTSAVTYVEAVLIDMAPWPRRYAKGGVVTQLNTLFEDLLERQNEHLVKQEQRQIEVLSHLDAIADEARQLSLQTEATLHEVAASGQKVATQIDAAAVRIDEVVQTGIKTIDGLKDKNTTSFSEWKQSADDELKAVFEEMNKDIDAGQKEVTAKLEHLRKTAKDYDSLTTADAAGVLAQHFATESRTTRTTSLTLLIAGFVFLIAAAAPFVPLLFENDETPPTWQSIVLRLSFGALAASAATVAIRLGSRFSAEATASKRMEMELRTFGPFLAANTDQENVDAARLELIDRAFGKSYIAHLGGRPDEDTVPVSGLTDIINAIGRVAGRQ
ncbi:hypothetical protein ACX80L_14120 [Arthrobacter sp. MDT1-48-3]